MLCVSVGSADHLSHHFDRKQSRESVDLPFTCQPSHRLSKFPIRSSEVRRLMLDLVHYGGTNLLGMFPVFIKRTVNVQAPS